MSIRRFLVIGLFGVATALLIEFSYRVYLFGLDGLSIAKVDSVGYKSTLLRPSPILTSFSS